MALVLGVASIHMKLLLAVPLIVLCFVCYAFVFWILAVDAEDRTTIYGLRQRAFAILRGRRATPAMRITGNDAAL